VNVCESKIVLMVFFLLFLVSGEAFSGALTKADFRASLAPPVLSLSMGPGGGIQGNTTVAVRVQRIKRNKVSFCNKIKFLEIVRGGDYKVSDNGPDFLGRLSMMPRGQCFFDATMHVTPFTDDEIRSACKGLRKGANRRLVKDGLVTAWNQGDMSYLHRMWDNGGLGGKPKNQARVTFKASVSCGTPASGSDRMSGRFTASCVDKNRGISVQVDMKQGVGTLFMNGNHVFHLGAKYLPIRGTSPRNLIELKGNGAQAFHLNMGRKILYFREGVRGEFCKLKIAQQ